MFKANFVCFTIIFLQFGFCSVQNMEMQSTFKNVVSDSTINIEIKEIKSILFNKETKFKNTNYKDFNCCYAENNYVEFSYGKCFSPGIVVNFWLSDFKKNEGTNGVLSKDTTVLHGQTKKCDSIKIILHTYFMYTFKGEDIKDVFILKSGSTKYFYQTSKSIRKNLFVLKHKCKNRIYIYFETPLNNFLQKNIFVFEDQKLVYREIF